jgi:hypothetical protein
LRVTEGGSPASVVEGDIDRSPVGDGDEETQAESAACVGIVYPFDGPRRSSTIVGGGEVGEIAVAFFDELDQMEGM